MDFGCNLLVNHSLHAFSEFTDFLYLTDSIDHPFLFIYWGRNGLL